jgi:hypothetical protein
MGRFASGICGGMSEMREYDIFDMSDTIGKTGESYARLATNGTMLADKTYTLYLTNS